MNRIAPWQTATHTRKLLVDYVEYSRTVTERNLFETLYERERLITGVLVAALFCVALAFLLYVVTG